MKKMILSIKVALFIIINSSLLYSEEYKPDPIPEIEMKCSNSSFQEIEWSYCISKTAKSKSRDILYHLHGRNGNATWWNDQSYHTGQIHNVWVKDKKDPPIVITVSFGKLWFLLRSNNDKNLMNIFLKKVMKEVEKQLKMTPSSRSILGISMGGLNAFYLSMTNADLFNKAVILCAHIPLTSHHDSFINLVKYYFEHKISLKRSFMMYKMSQKFFKNRSTFMQNNAHNLLKQIDINKTPDFYISCGHKDSWGCMKSSEFVANQIQIKGGNVVWAPRPGGHCDLDHKSIARFLID